MRMTMMIMTMTWRMRMRHCLHRVLVLPRPIGDTSRPPTDHSTPPRVGDCLPPPVTIPGRKVRLSARFLLIQALGDSLKVRGIRSLPARSLIPVPIPTPILATGLSTLYFPFLPWDPQNRQYPKPNCEVPVFVFILLPNHHLRLLRLCTTHLHQASETSICKPCHGRTVVAIALRAI